MLLKIVMEFVVPVLIVVENDAAGGRIDGDPFDPRDDPESLLDLLEQSGIALAGRNLDADSPANLMFDLEIEFCHRPP